MIVLNDLSYRSENGNNVFDTINLNFKRGEFIILTGPTGSGKTTLLHLLMGFIKPTSGYIEVEGKLKKAFLFQNPQDQLFCKTVKNELFYAPIKQGCENPDFVVERLIEELKVDRKLLERSPLNLSSGQQRKVAIASVLTGEPDLILLDEPSVFLDLDSISLLRTLLLERKVQGKTIIIATHWPELFDDMATERIELIDGKIISYKSD